MNSLAPKNNDEATAVSVSFTDMFLCLQLSDGREIRTPLDFFPKLKKANKEQRNNYKIIGLGTGIHWPDLDEDLSVEGIIRGIPSRF